MNGTEKLKRDLEALEAMAAEMDEYLRSDLLFWPMRQGDLPRLTLGGYLIREHRLLELRDLLDLEEQERLHEAVTVYHVALESKAHEELEARQRQWQEYLREVKRGQSIDYYESAVETRAMIEALTAQLKVDPYKLQARVAQKTAMLDRELRRYWESGAFIWPQEWEPAYPEARYWWLYGTPRRRES
jgi:hypothetical protein